MAISPNMPCVLTVITICRDELEGLRKTVRSVQGQEDVDIEHIVIDGASQDGTAEWLRQDSRHLTFVSEPDKGRYDAMNKGAQKGMGEFLWFMHAGDTFATSTSAALGVKSLRESHSMWGYGLSRVSRDGKVVAIGGSIPFNRGRFLLGGRIIPHQAALFRASFFHELGGYDCDFGLAEDQHFFVKAIKCQPPAVIPDILCDFDGSGAGSVRGTTPHFVDMTRAKLREQTWATGSAIADVLLTVVLAIAAILRSSLGRAWRKAAK
jgi:glycosyltransferase involved in cell wall biosynthesis